MDEKDQFTNNNEKRRCSSTSIDQGDPAANRLQVMMTRPWAGFKRRWPGGRLSSSTTRLSTSIVSTQRHQHRKTKWAKLLLCLNFIFYLFVQLSLAPLSQFLELNILFMTKLQRSSKGLQPLPKKSSYLSLANGFIKVRLFIACNGFIKVEFFIARNGFLKSQAVYGSQMDLLR